MPSPPPPLHGVVEAYVRAPWLKLIFNAWCHLGLWELCSDLSFPLYKPSLSSSEQAVANAHAFALVRDLNTDWYVKDITLTQCCTSLDFPLTLAISLMARLYMSLTPMPRFVLIMMAQNWHTTLSLLWPSMLLWCFLAFFLSDDPSLTGHFAEATTKKEVHVLYNSILWVKRTKKRGMKDTTIFIAMFTVFNIALYEPDSPLSKHIAASPRKGLGDPWIEKYCISAKFLLVFGCSLGCCSS